MAALQKTVLDPYKPLPERIAAGKLRLCVQAFIRYSDLKGTPIGCLEWVRRPGEAEVVGLRARTLKGKSGPRLWVASLRGVSEAGDGWLNKLTRLLLEAHGDRWVSDDRTGKLADVQLVKKTLGEYKQEGLDVGLSDLGLGGLRWHGAKASLSSLMQRLELPARVIRFQRKPKPWSSEHRNSA